VILAILLVSLPLFMIVEELKAYLGFTPTAEEMRNRDHELGDLPSRPAIQAAGKGHEEVEGNSWVPQRKEQPAAHER